jgi:predicted nucleic acid-binding protein
VTYCLDASAVIAFLIPLSASHGIARVWEDILMSGERLVAPHLLYSESTSVVRRYVYAGAISHEEAQAALQRLLRLPISPMHSREIYLRALEFAHRRGHAKAYDVQYMAVAQMENAVLVTVDRGMYENARVFDIPARLLA